MDRGSCRDGWVWMRLFSVTGRAFGSVRVHTKSWLATGDLAMWQLRSTKLCTALGCAGVLVLVVTAVAFLFTVGMSFGTFSSNEVTAADPGTIPAPGDVSTSCGDVRCLRVHLRACSPLLLQASWSRVRGCRVGLGE